MALGPLSTIVGVPLASVAFAFPSMVQGDDFTTAYFTEWMWRLKTLASVAGTLLGGAGGGDAYAAYVGEQLGPVVASIQTFAGEAGSELSSAWQQLSGTIGNPPSWAAIAKATGLPADPTAAAKALGIPLDQVQGYMQTIQNAQNAFSSLASEGPSAISAALAKVGLPANLNPATLPMPGFVQNLDKMKLLIAGVREDVMVHAKALQSGYSLPSNFCSDITTGNLPRINGIPQLFTPAQYLNFFHATWNPAGLNPMAVFTAAMNPPPTALLVAATRVAGESGALLQAGAAAATATNALVAAARVA